MSREQKRNQEDNWPAAENNNSNEDNASLDGSDDNDNEIDVDDSEEYKFGKVPVMPELCCKICIWSLAWGTSD
eukprot:4834820-Ditylum_brightwellii.AAC.1